MNWKIIFGAGLLLLLSGVLIGIVDGGHTSNSKHAAMAWYGGDLAAHFLLYSATFAWVAYRQSLHLVVHAALAVLVAFILATGSLAVVDTFFPLPPIDRPLILQAMDWAVTAISAVVGLSLGHHLAKKRRVAHATDDA